MTLLCVLAGIAGGLGIGYVLSRRGEWLVVQPWIIYAAALLVATAAITWLDVRRRPGVIAPAVAAHADGLGAGQPDATDEPGEVESETARGGAVE